MLRYAITDRLLFPGTELEQRSAVLAQASRLSSQGVDYLQIREKDLSSTELLELAWDIRRAVEASGGRTQVLLNGSAQQAAIAGAGTHLPFDVWAKDEKVVRVTSISCHTPEQVEAASAFADVLLFAPVFEKQVRGERIRSGTGLAALREACARSNGTPVLALGGVTLENAADCMAAGASGIAGIRLFLA